MANGRGDDFRRSVRLMRTVISIHYPRRIAQVFFRKKSKNFKEGSLRISRLSFASGKTSRDRRAAPSRVKFPIKVQLCRTFIPLPAPRRRGRPCRAGARGVTKKVSSELFSYIGGTASPLYERQRFSCRSGSARCGRSRHPRAATDAPRRRCGSCPTGRPADDGCPMRSSRSSPERLPESASCR